MFLKKSGTSALVCSLLGMFAFAGLVASQSAAPKDRKHDDLENLETILKLVKDQIALVRNSHGNLDKVQTNYKLDENKIVALESETVTAGTNSPVKIRGGAMTFRFASGAVIDKDANGNFCSVIDKSTSISLFEHPDEKGTTAKADYQYSLSPGVQIDLFGYTRGGKSDSNNGIQVLITNTCKTNQLGASLIPEPNSSSLFYPFEDNASDDPTDKSTRRRFEDTACVGQQPPDQNGDEDTCEHLAKVYIHSSPSANPKSNLVGNTPWSCERGECLVLVGN